MTASTASSQYGYFSTSGNTDSPACSHFHVALDGQVEQYIDTSRLSAAESAGSNDAISIETAGLGSGSWTANQIAALKKLLAWINKTHGIPLRAKTTSRPDEAGIGWHRLGIRGNFPSSPAILRGLNQIGTGESWSGAFGKECPGDERILQTPGLIALAASYAGSDDSHSVELVSNPIRQPSPSALLADGWFGPQTARALQRAMGTPADGVVSSQYAQTPSRTKYLTSFEWVSVPKGSAVIRAVQKRLGVTSDGILGPVTTRTWQKSLGVTSDGVFGPETTRALQNSLNRKVKA